MVDDGLEVGDSRFGGLEESELAKFDLCSYASVICGRRWRCRRVVGSVHGLGRRFVAVGTSAALGAAFEDDLAGNVYDGGFAPAGDGQVIDADDAAVRARGARCSWFFARERGADGHALASQERT
jgi:hypothetical protein